MAEGAENQAKDEERSDEDLGIPFVFVNRGFSFRINSTHSSQNNINGFACQRKAIMFVHVVLFWFKAEASAQARAQVLTDSRELLSRIGTVRKLEAGKPAMTPREVVDNSYDLGLCVLFDDQAGHDAYQVHELHEQFIARNKATWQRVQVYDFA